MVAWFPYSPKTSRRRTSPSGSSAARSRSLIMKRVGFGTASAANMRSPEASGVTPSARTASTLPVAAACSSCSTRAAAGSPLRVCPAADTGQSIARTRRARRTMRRSILDPVQLDGGRKHSDIVGGPGREPGPRAGRMTRRPRGALLLLLAGVAAVFAAFVAATGGIDTRIAGIAVRSRSWERPATVAFVLALAGLYAVRQTLRSWGPLASRLGGPGARRVGAVRRAVLRHLCGRRRRLVRLPVAGAVVRAGPPHRHHAAARGLRLARRSGDVDATGLHAERRAGRARARLPARPLADDGAADADPPRTPCSCWSRCAPR